MGVDYRKCLRVRGHKQQVFHQSTTWSIMSLTFCFVLNFWSIAWTDLFPSHQCPNEIGFFHSFVLSLRSLSLILWLNSQSFTDFLTRRSSYEPNKLLHFSCMPKHYAVWVHVFSAKKYELTLTWSYCQDTTVIWKLIVSICEDDTSTALLFFILFFR